MNTHPSVVQRLFHLFPALLGIGLFSLSVWIIGQEFQDYHPQEVLRSLIAIPHASLGLALMLTLLNYSGVTGYDLLAGLYVRHTLPWHQTALVAFTSTAVSNNVGFALLSASAIRYRLYSAWRISNSQIANIIAFCNSSYWSGLLAVGGIIFVWEPITIPKLLHLPFHSIHSLGFVCLATVTLYLLTNALSHNHLKLGSWIIPHISLKLALGQVAIASLDWMLAASVLYALLPSDPFSYPTFLGIYLLAQVAGLMSNIPGGLGVFETVMLLLISPPIPSATLLGALLAYRSIYYLLPFFVAIIILGVYEVKQHLKT